MVHARDLRMTGANRYAELQSPPTRHSASR
jgi:hypothetical protein